MMKYWLTAFGFFFVFVVVPAIAETPGFTIIVNAKNSVESISKKELSAMFLKRISKWNDGKKIMPVDLKYDSPIRETFSNVILGKTVQSAKAYWQQQLFGGYDVPPPEKENEMEVLKYVSQNSGAIGYVSDQADIGSEIKILFIKNSSK